MRLTVEDYLHKIDQALKEKSNKEKQMIYIMVALGIFAFAYLFFWDSSFDRFEKTRQSVKHLQTLITIDEAYLKHNPDTVIVQLNKEIQNINTQTKSYKQNNLYINEKLQSISTLLYDKKTWGRYLDSITANAQKYHIKLNTFTNHYTSEKKAFGHVLDIQILASGNYHNMLKFINALEQSELVVDIHGFELQAVHKAIDTNLTISVWGISYK